MMRIIALGLLFLGVTGCVSLEDRTSSLDRQTAVNVDQRIELMSVIQLMSDYFLVSQLESDYKQRATEFFAPCVDHAAVVEFRELAANGFAFSTVPDAFIALSQPPKLEQRFPVKDEVLESVRGTKNYETFLTLVRAFERDCGFSDFFAAHEGYYAELSEQTRGPIEASTRTLVSYLGTPFGQTEVVLGPLLHDGGFATLYTDRVGSPIAYAFIGPTTLQDRKASFGTAERLQPLVAHEFAHTVINPLTARFAKDVQRSAGNFTPLVEAMRLEGYDTWGKVVNESIIRAVTARITTLERGEAAGSLELAEEMRRGYVYAPALVESLKKYEANRNIYPTIESYYPQLLRVFQQAPGSLAAS